MRDRDSSNEIRDEGREFRNLPKIAPVAPLGGQLYRLLEESIIMGELLPGQRLDEKRLADHFGVSRIPLREAMSGLEVAGWIERTRGRQGARVREATAAELANLSEVREVLDGECAALAAEHRTESQLKAMWAMIETSRLATQRTERTRIVELNTKFHMLIATATRNPVFVEILSILDKRVRRLLWLAKPGVLDASLEEHEALVSAIQGRNMAGARLLARTHARHSWSDPVPPDEP
jgi:DNA-binding GntR family transcriptional regulator